jgi:hypothetical protein
MVKWDDIKQDLQKGWKEGVVALKEGMVVVRKKAGEMTDEGKRKYKVLSLKATIQKSIHDLGNRVYTLMTSPKTSKSLAADDKVKSIVVQIRKYERQIADLEQGGGEGRRQARKPAGRPARKAAR